MEAPTQILGKLILLKMSKAANVRFGLIIEIWVLHCNLTFASKPNFEYVQFWLNLSNFVCACRMPDTRLLKATQNVAKIVFSWTILLRSCLVVYAGGLLIFCIFWQPIIRQHLKSMFILTILIVFSRSCWSFGVGGGAWRSLTRAARKSWLKLMDK